MKKTITILLLTALCMTVLTSCDLGNGLVAELFGNIRDDYEYGYVAPPAEDVYESADVEIDWDTVVLEPPQTEVRSPWVVDYMVNTIDEYGYNGKLRRTQELYSNLPENLELIKTDEGTRTLDINGWIGLADAQYVRFGYSINDNEPVFSEAFQRDPDPLLKEDLADRGADCINSFCINISTRELHHYNNTIRIWYEAYPVGAEQGECVQRELFYFVLEYSPYNDETACG